MFILLPMLLGIIQGLAEFLPVSSSGHLALFQSFFGNGLPKYDDTTAFNALFGHELIKDAYITSTDCGSGITHLEVKLKDQLYYKVISELTGFDIDGEESLEGKAALGIGLYGLPVEGYACHLDWLAVLASHHLTGNGADLHLCRGAHKRSYGNQQSDKCSLNHTVLVCFFLSCVFS